MSILTAHKNKVAPKCRAATAQSQQEWSRKYLTCSKRSSIVVTMNRLDNATRSRIIACLVEGNSIRATVRITGAAKNTVTKLLVELGEKCRDFHDKHVRQVFVRRVQVDEIWSFIGAKAKNVPEEKKGTGISDVWTW